MNKKRIIIGTLVSCLLCVIPALCVDVPEFSEGMAAYKRGDYTTALRLFALCAAHRKPMEPRALTMLGHMSLHGEGTERNEKVALKLYRRAAEIGFPLAQTQVGVMYREGIGVKQDIVKALQWFRKAAEQGDGGAMVLIGYIYYDGQGVPQNYAEALKWFRRATKERISEAMDMLGIMYYFGHGVVENYVMAHMWFNIATAHGLAETGGKRDSLAKFMTSEQIADAQRRALEWMEKNKEISESP